MPEIKHMKSILLGIAIVVGSGWATIQGYRSIVADFATNSDIAQLKDDITIMNLENRIHGDGLYLLGLDARTERGIALTRTELRTYDLITASISRMTTKREEMQGL